MKVRYVFFPVCVLGLLALPLCSQATLHDVAGATADSFGQVCDLVGDTNGDGFGEFLVGAWRADNGALTDAGSVFLYSGADGTLLSTIRAAEQPITWASARAPRAT